MYRQGSWSHKIWEKFNNASKYQKRVYGSIVSDSPVSSKKLKVDNGTEFSASEEDITAMKVELQNNRPRENILIELMQATFPSRKSLINEKKSVADILLTYPALKLPKIVS